MRSDLALSTDVRVGSEPKNVCLWIQKLINEDIFLRVIGSVSIVALTNIFKLKNWAFHSMRVSIEPILLNYFTRQKLIF